VDSTPPHSFFPQSHAGLFNLSVVILLAVNSRLIIENLMKYGLLLRFDVSHLTQALRDWPLLVCALSVPLFPVLAVQLEKWKIKSPALSERVRGTEFVCAVLTGLNTDGSDSRFQSLELRFG
jgi:hypothetical protein